MRTRYFDLQGASLAVSATDLALIEVFGRILDQSGDEQSPA